MAIKFVVRFYQQMAMTPTHYPFFPWDGIPVYCVHLTQAQIDVFTIELKEV